jgi:hypothetical protein
VEPQQIIYLCHHKHQTTSDRSDAYRRELDNTSSVENKEPTHNIQSKNYIITWNRVPRAVDNITSRAWKENIAVDAGIAYDVQVAFQSQAIIATVILYG